MSAVPLAELAAVRWGPVAGAASAAAALAVLDLTVWSRGPGSELVVLVAGLLGGAAALGLDDPASGVTRGVPTTRRRRTGVRLVVAAGAVALWCLYVARVAHVVPASWVTLAVIGGGVVSLCVGSACALGRDGDGQPGTLVASTAVLGTLGLMILPVPGEVAVYDASSRWTDATRLWTGLGLVGVAALCWGSADAWRRGFRQPRTAAIVSRYQP